MSMFKKQIVIIGSSKATKELENIAYETGSLIAKHGYVVVCGGKAGIMEAVCKGAKYEGGMTIGIIPENEVKLVQSLLNWTKETENFQNHKGIWSYFS